MLNNVEQINKCHIPSKLCYVQEQLTEIVIPGIRQRATSDALYAEYLQAIQIEKQLRHLSKDVGTLSVCFRLETFSLFCDVNYPVTGRHSQRSPLHGGVYEHRCCSAGVYTGDAVRLKYIYSRCCSVEIYTGDAVLLEHIIMGDAVLLLAYIKAMLGVATLGSGDA